MAYRVANYNQAFLDELGVIYGQRAKAFVARMEKLGHTEKSICFAIWKSKNKLVLYRGDEHFYEVLEEAVKKWSWPKGDPRWNNYWARKNEEKKVNVIREEIFALQNEKCSLKDLDNQNLKTRFRKGSDSGYVYFFQGECGGAIKIGFSQNPASRLKELQTGYPDTLMVLAIIPGSRDSEQSIHSRFGNSRLRGEWFRPDLYVLQGIKDLKEEYAPKQSKMVRGVR